MSAIIGADAAKLAGLQIDTLQKVRSGQITLSQLERFNLLSPEDREARFGDWKKSEPKTSAEPTNLSAEASAQAGKFALLVDLGIITVPDDYDHRTALESFGKKNRKRFYYYNDEITDKNFPKPTRILKSGDKLHVRAFEQVVLGATTSEERMDFLRKEKAVFTGAQGASLVFEEMRDKLPKDKWYSSFDEKERLWINADGYSEVPCVFADSDGDFEFHLGIFGDGWRVNSAFLCFCDLEPESLGT